MCCEIMCCINVHLHHIHMTQSHHFISSLTLTHQLLMLTLSRLLSSMNFAMISTSNVRCQLYTVQASFTAHSHLITAEYHNSMIFPLPLLHHTLPSLPSHLSLTLLISFFIPPSCLHPLSSSFPSWHHLVTK